MKESNFVGPQLVKNEFFNSLPQELQAELEQVNGFVVYSGGFHLRGICSEPIWHSLEEVVSGESALFEYFEEVNNGDIPFAQDCMGDQFILRADKVIRLYAEAGELEPLNMGLVEFMNKIRNDHEDLLDLEVLEVVADSEEGALEPGEVLIADPPFAMEESEQGVKLAAIPAMEALQYYAELAQQIQSVARAEEVDD